MLSFGSTTTSIIQKFPIPLAGAEIIPELGPTRVNLACRFMDALAQIADATRGTDWEDKLFLVGGAVRDELLGLPRANDFDIVLQGDAAALARFLHEQGQASTPVTYPRFGTAMVRVGDATIEIVTARKESYVEDSRKPSVTPTTLEDDVKRRDFTINTLMRSIHGGPIVDLLGTGIEDLENRILRTPLDPIETFSDDPLRMVRAIRFRSQFSLSPAPGLFDAIRSSVERLRIVSYERIRDEFEKMLVGNNPVGALHDLMETGLLNIFAPEFSDGIGIEQGSYHSKDVWGHTLDVVREATGKGLTVVLGALFHDIGKPQTRTVEPDGRVRFFGHEVEGEKITRRVMRRMKFANDVIDGVAAIVRNHMRLGSAVPFTPAAARRLRRDLGDMVEPLLEVCEADASALARIPKGIDFADVRAKLAQVGQAVENRTFDSPLSGAEIMEITGLEQGPEVGRLKRMLSDAVVDGRIAPDDREAAKALLRE